MVNSTYIDTHISYCVQCRDGGDLMCCDGCPGAYHPACLGLENVPNEPWFCPACIQVRSGCAVGLWGSAVCLVCQGCAGSAHTDTVPSRMNRAPLPALPALGACLLIPATLSTCFSCRPPATRPATG